MKSTQAQEVPERGIAPGHVLVPAIIALLLIGLSVVLWKALTGQEMRQLQVEISTRAAQMADQLEQDMRARSGQVARMARRWEIRGGTPRKEWEADASSYLADGAFAHLQWCDPTGRVQWVVPARRTSEIDPLPIQREAHKEAMATSRTRQAPESTPVERSGDRFFITTYVSTHTSESFWGWMAGVIDLTNWMEQQTADVSDLHVMVSENAKPVYVNSRPSSASQERASTVPLRISPSDLRLSIAPTSAALAAARTAFPATMLAVGIVLSLLTAWAVFLSLRGRYQYLALKAATAAREKAEAQARTLLDQLPMPVLFKDAERNYALCNEAFASARGITTETLEGLDDAAFLSPEQAARFAACDERAIGDGLPCEHEEVATVGEQERIYQIVHARVTNRKGNVLGVLELHHDITAQRRREQREREIDRRISRARKLESVGEMVGWLAHDLNNILAPVKGYPELILADLPEDAEWRGDLLEIKQAGERAELILADLLMLNPRQTHEAEPVLVDRQVNRFLESDVFAQLTAKHPQVQIVTACQGEQHAIKATPNRMQQLLRNLFTHALHASDPAGTLHFATACESLPDSIKGYDAIEAGDYVTLRMRDTGEAIPERYLERMFEPFFLKDKLQRDGTGLGLATIYGITKDLNGFIDVHSGDEGTELVLYFPVATEVPGPSEEELRDLTGSEHVLVVDDALQQRELASRFLTSLGYEVSAADSGEQAIEYLRVNSADLVLLDMHLEGGIDGLETFIRISEINPRQRCVVASGFADTARMHEALQYGALARIKKPFSIDKLGRVVRGALDAKATTARTPSLAGD